ncbi:uncharacterized protein LTR77_002654 [Saxophila tyrrhenica]|uniref:Uncharacterized protein n=1 Tax=Saxophila tyrrhenica TaxID=1690608 RepID=A0AAV9PI09_9PEZI|nr:hypothetical protein LTR77_002654 [Saxophila tyrrhenica]
MTRLICHLCRKTNFGPYPTEDKVLDHLRYDHGLEWICTSKVPAIRKRQDAAWEVLYERVEDALDQFQQRQARNWEAFAADPSKPLIPTQHGDLVNLHERREAVTSIAEDDVGIDPDGDRGLDDTRGLDELRRNQQFELKTEGYATSLRYSHNCEAAKMDRERVKAFLAAKPGTPFGRFMEDYGRDLRALSLEDTAVDYAAARDADLRAMGVELRNSPATKGKKDSEAASKGVAEGQDVVMGEDVSAEVDAIVGGIDELLNAFGLSKMPQLTCPIPGCKETRAEQKRINSHLRSDHDCAIPNHHGGNMNKLRREQQAFFTKWLQKHGYARDISLFETRKYLAGSNQESGGSATDDDGDDSAENAIDDLGAEAETAAYGRSARRRSVRLEAAAQPDKVVSSVLTFEESHVVARARMKKALEDWLVLDGLLEEKRVQKEQEEERLLQRYR